MTETSSDFLSSMAARIAASDAKADAELAEIMAGRPYKKRAVKADPETDGTEKKAPARSASTRKAPATPRKPRAKRAPTKQAAE